MIEIKNSLKPKFPRGTMLRNKQTNKLLYVVETPLRCKIFLGDKPAYILAPYIKRDGHSPVPEDLTTTVFEQKTTEDLFVIVL